MAVVNNAATNTGLQVSETLLLILLGTDPEVELCLMRYFCVDYLRNCHMVPDPFS